MANLRSAASRHLRSWGLQPDAAITKSGTRALTATSNRQRTTSGPFRPQGNTSSLPPVYIPTPDVARREIPPHRVTPQNTSTQFDKLINDITHSLTTTSRPSLPVLHNLLRGYTSEPGHWSQYAHGNPTKQYTRNLVYSVPGVFNLLLLVWTPGQKSPIHDHADAHCLMKVLKGSIVETRFATPSNPGSQGPLQRTSTQNFELNKVSYMADCLGLHSIANPHPSEYAVSLHLYAPPHAATRGCNVFDEESGSAKHVKQCLFDSVGGELVVD